jgi:hypothetical protein
MKRIFINYAIGDRRIYLFLAKNGDHGSPNRELWEHLIELAVLPNTSFRKAPAEFGGKGF